MTLERRVNLLKALFRNPFAQHLLATQISQQVERNAAYGRSQRSEKHIQNKMATVVVHIPSDHRIHGHPQQRRIRESDGKRSPDPQRPEQQEYPRLIARQDVSDGFQQEFSLRERRKGHAGTAARSTSLRAGSRLSSLGKARRPISEAS